MSAQLERAERKGNDRRVAELERDLALPPFPRALAYVWQAYLRLRRRTAGGFSGPQPIGWQEIDAFVRRSGIRLAPWEIELIETLDDIYLRPEPKVTMPDGQAVTMVAPASDAVAVRAVLRRDGKKKKREGAKHG